jgi:hypothetical protein
MSENTAVVKAGTVKTAFARMLATCQDESGPMYGFIKQLGQDPVDVAILQTLSAYKGQTVELPDETQIVLSTENFDQIVSSEAEKLASAANAMIADFSTAAAPLLTQLRELRTQAQALLTAKDERLALPEYADFAVRAGRKSGTGSMGNGGSARVVYDYSSDQYIAPKGAEKGWVLLVNSRDVTGNPTGFKIMSPDGAEGETVYPSINKAASAVCLLVDKKPGVRAPLFWGIPERAATEAEIESGVASDESDDTDTDLETGVVDAA